MTNPIIANNKPTPVSLNKDEEYYFCSCGHSKKQPFCDGSRRHLIFKDLSTAEDFKRFADRVREATGGIPIGFKLKRQSY